MCIMPRPYPREFREDVVRVARNREPGVRVKDIAADFGISESCLTNWLTQADRDEGVRPGPTSDEQAENRELRRRVRLLEQENEVLRRARRFATRPARPGHGPTRVPPGTVLALGIMPGNTVATSRRTPRNSATLWAATWAGWVTIRSAPAMASRKSLVSSSIWSNTNRLSAWRRPRGTR
jgi:transposase